MATSKQQGKAKAKASGWRRQSGWVYKLGKRKSCSQHHIAWNSRGGSKTSTRMKMKTAGFLRSSTGWRMQRLLWSTKQTKLRNYITAHFPIFPSQTLARFSCTLFSFPLSLPPQHLLVHRNWRNNRHIHENHQIAWDHSRLWEGCAPRFVLTWKTDMRHILPFLTDTRLHHKRYGVVLIKITNAKRRNDKDG